MFPKPAHTRADELKHILRIKRKRPAPGHYGLRAQDPSRLEAPSHQNSPETNRKSSDFRREPTCSRTQDWQRCNISNITLHGGLEATTSSNVDISRKCAHDKTSTGMRCASENRRHLEQTTPPSAAENKTVSRAVSVHDKGMEIPQPTQRSKHGRNPAKEKAFSIKAAHTASASSALQEQAWTSAEERSANIFGDARSGCVRRDARSTTGAHAAACCASKTIP